MRAGGKGFTTAIVAAALFAGLVLVLLAAFPEVALGEPAWQRIVHAGAWLTVLGSAVAMTYRRQWSRAAKHALAWLLMLVALVGLYSFRHDLEPLAFRLAGELVPGMAVEQGGGTVAISRSSDGHHYVRATVNGTTIRMMVDTGASMVALSHADARRIGLDTDALSFTLTVSTANGMTRAAPVRLRSVRIGSIELDDVRASVSRPGDLDESLLGQSFLRRLRGYRVEGDRLILQR